MSAVELARRENRIAMCDGGGHGETSFKFFQQFFSAFSAFQRFQRFQQLSAVVSS